MREALALLGIEGGIEITSIADIPARGTGLGSSSAFTVGLLNALHAYRGCYASAARLAEESCHIEIERCGEPIGKQDQYGCALGGMNFLTFNPDESVEVEAVPITTEMRQRLEQCLVMFYLGGTRSASELLKDQGARLSSDANVIEDMKAMARSAYSLRTEIQGNVDVIGPYLHEAWERKRRQAAGISSPIVDDAYARVLAAGATGGKLLGAGGSGFLLAYVPGGLGPDVRAALPEYPAYDVRLDTIGTTIIYSD